MNRILDQVRAALLAPLLRLARWLDPDTRRRQ
jgi:hypothetical protein